MLKEAELASPTNECPKLHDHITRCLMCTQLVREDNAAGRHCGHHLLPHLLAADEHHLASLVSFRLSFCHSQG
jgi:hypothetical protein